MLKIFSCLGLLFVFVSCSSTQTKHVLSDQRLRSITPQERRLAVPFTVQTQELCGPTALKMVLDSEGISSELDQLIKFTYSPQVKGSTKSDMLGAVRRLGLVPIKVRTLYELLRHISKGRAAVVFYNSAVSWSTLWHFGVLTGYDLEAEKVYLHAGESENQRMNLAWFYERWSEGDHWAMVVSTPQNLPAKIDLKEMIENIDVFINLEQLDVARALLVTLLSRYPDEKLLLSYRQILGV